MGLGRVAFILTPGCSPLVNSSEPDYSVASPQITGVGIKVPYDSSWPGSQLAELGELPSEVSQACGWACVIRCLPVFGNKLIKVRAQAAY
jgi:hypothetical protein